MIGNPYQTSVKLFDRQIEALDAGIDELLVGGISRPCGVSYLLRAVGFILANNGLEALLAKQSYGDLSKEHIEGEQGIRAMLATMEQHGACEIKAQEVKFPNGSSLRWTGLGTDGEVRRALDRRVDVLLVDDVNEVPESIYMRLRQHALNSRKPGRRVIASCTRVGAAGWVDNHWNGASVPGRGFMEFSTADIDSALVVRPPDPTYREFIESIHGGQWIWTPLVEHVVSVVERWIKGEWEHLSIHMPSQQGKSSCGPLNGVGYILTLFPTEWCAVVSYGSDFANTRSVEARDFYVRSGGEIAEGRGKSNEWLTRQGGGCWSAGTAAGQAGRSAQWVFLDDGDKDWEDAINRTKQGKKRRYFTSVLRDRESMYALRHNQKICNTSTRWDPGDLSGHGMQVGHDTGEQWAIMVLPALYDPSVADAYRQMYPNFEVLPDFRTVPGEAIWPERRSAEEWEKVRIRKGARIFLTESQQHAKGVEQGGIMYASWFPRLDKDPAFVTEKPNEGVYAEQCRAWDLAGTEGGGDWTAGSKLGRLRDDDVASPVIIRHVVRAQLSPSGVEQLIAAIMILDGSGVNIRIPIDPASGGVATADSIERYLMRVALRVGMLCPKIIKKRPRKTNHATLSAKAARARDFQSFAEPGGIAYVGARWGPAVSDRIQDYADVARDWPELTAIAEKGSLAGGDYWTPFMEEVESFTGEDGRTDDQVDSAVDAFDEVRYNVTPYAAAIRRR